MQIVIKCMFEETCWSMVNKMTEKMESHGNEYNPPTKDILGS